VREGELDSDVQKALDEVNQRIDSVLAELEEIRQSSKESTSDSVTQREVRQIADDLDALKIKLSVRGTVEYE
jgi:hypothetical protein